MGDHLETQVADGFLVQFVALIRIISFTLQSKYMEPSTQQRLDNRTQQTTASVLIYFGYTVPLHVLIIWIIIKWIRNEEVIAELLNCDLMLKGISVKWIHFSYQNLCYILVSKR